MSATTTPRKTLQMQGNPLPEVNSFPVKANEIILQGTLTLLDSSGRLIAGAAATGCMCPGMADPNKPSVDATGLADGAVRANVIPGCFAWASGTAADAILADDVGKLCYVIDNQTVGLTDGTGTRSIAGTIYGIAANGQVFVYSNLAPGVDGTALAAEIAARLAFENSLTLTTASNGASLVGIQDAANLYTATTVEGALAELITGLRVANTANVNVIGGVPVMHRITVPSGADGNVDVVLTHKTLITDFWLFLKGAGTAGCLVTAKNGATAISNAINVASGSDKDVFRAGQIDDAQYLISAAGTLRISKASTGGDFPGAECYVLGLRSA